MVAAHLCFIQLYTFSDMYDYTPSLLHTSAGLVSMGGLLWLRWICWHLWSDRWSCLFFTGGSPDVLLVFRHSLYDFQSVRVLFFSSWTLSVHHEVLAVYTCTSSMCPSKPSNTKLRCCSLGLGRWPRVLSWPNTTSFSSSSVAHLTQKMLKCHVHLRCEPLEIPFAPLKA